MGRFSVILRGFVSSVLMLGLIGLWYGLTQIPGYFEAHAGSWAWVVGAVVSLALVLPAIALTTFALLFILALWDE